ncbi:FAD binding domain-containing protein [Sarocladium implicatum]|nr:FAD binding domain-containing protein [Sarocladium implicatum]
MRGSLALLGALGALHVIATDSKYNVAQCCKELLTRFPEQVASASDTAYPTWNHRWADTAELSPSCIFQPRSAEDVAAAVTVLANEDDNRRCPFSLVAGGHTPWAGANNINSGVALNLSQLNDVVIADDRSHVKLGAGARWHDAYVKTDSEGLVYPGGRCPDVGVAGLTLGGGYSWFSGEMGFVVDNVINFEVVLASGEIVNANERENADLWKALRGGSNNFGVVTRFDIRATEHDQQVYGGLVIVPGSLTDEVLPALYNFTDDSSGIHNTAGLTVEYYIDTVTGDEQILLWLIDTDVSASHESLQPFFDMEPKYLNQVYQTSIADYPTSIPAVSRVLMADATFVNDLAALKAVYNVTMNIKDSLSHVPDLVWDFQFEPLPRHIIEASNSRGGNVLGLQDAQEDMLIIFIMPLWKDANYDGDINKAAARWVKEVQEVTNALGKGHSFEFANYAAGFQDVMRSYGPANHKFLSDVAKKYDPRGVFQMLVPGGYKLERKA